MAARFRNPASSGSGNVLFPEDDTAVTLEQLQAKREEILQRIGVARASFGERSFEFTDAQKALAAIDGEIEKLSAKSSARTTYAAFSKGRDR